MLYAILAYHEESAIEALTPAEDAALMDDLNRVHHRLHAEGKLGPAARLGPTLSARTRRKGVVTDGPFAETKEQLLGFYVMEFDSPEAAMQAADDLGRVNPSAVYEVRPISYYLPGAPLNG